MNEYQIILATLNLNYVVPIGLVFFAICLMLIELIQLNKEDKLILEDVDRQKKEEAKKLNTLEGGYVSVDVGPWSSYRKVFINAERVDLEVAMPESNCGRGCTSCQKRVAEVKETLRQKSIEHRWIRSGGATWVSFSRKEGGDPIVTLSNALGLRIVAR